MSNEVPGAAIPDMGAIDQVASTALDSPLGDTIGAFKGGFKRSTEFLHGFSSARGTKSEGNTSWGSERESINPYA
ncbi:hypothetical protein [Streptomyces sp. NPDC001108]